MAVIAADKYGRVGCHRVHPIVGGKRRPAPEFVVPGATEHPLALGKSLGVFANAAGKFLGRFCVAQLHAADFASAAAEMNMGVNKPGKDALALRIDLPRCGANPFRDFRIGASKLPGRANDPRVPVGEAEQIVAALRARHVPVEYMRFEDEGHGLIKRVNRLKAYPAIAHFLDKYVRGQN